MLSLERSPGLSHPIERVRLDQSHRVWLVRTIGARLPVRGGVRVNDRFARDCTRFLFSEFGLGLGVHCSPDGEVGFDLPASLCFVWGLGGVPG
jgi:hypothetical protein